MKKRPRDPNQLAKSIIGIATGQELRESEKEGRAPMTPAERGHLGGKKGGKARAKKLSASKRNSIAKKAAAARWRP